MSPLDLSGLAAQRASAREIPRLSVPASGPGGPSTLIEAAIVATLGTTSLAALEASALASATGTGLATCLASGTTASGSRACVRDYVYSPRAGRLQEGITALSGGVVDGVCRRLLDEPASPSGPASKGTPAAIMLP